MSKTTNSATLSTSQDYQLWVQPYLAQLEKIRQVLMAPYTIGSQHYGYDSGLGLVRGGNIEPSPAIGVGGGYNDVIVAIDNNLEGSASLDYFNSASSPLVGQAGFSVVNTNIYGNDRALLSKTWVGIGGCAAPFVQYNYPTSFALVDRREAEYGSFGPYSGLLRESGNHLGGIGNNCGTQGQTWFLPGYDSLPTSTSKPLIVTVFPSNQPVGSTGDLEELSFFIDQAYMQCTAGTTSCAVWQNAYLNAMSQYPFGAPRQALHFIQASRATAAWTLSNMTYNGMSAYQMLQNTISRVFSSAIGPDGGLYQSFSGGGSDKTPEPNFQAMIAFDPRMPSWFGQQTGSTSSSSTTHSTTSSTTSTTSPTTTRSTSSTTSSTTTSQSTTSRTTKSTTSSSTSSSSTTTSPTSTTSTTTSSTSTSTSSSSSSSSSVTSFSFGPLSTATITTTEYTTVTSPVVVTESASATLPPQTIVNVETSTVTTTVLHTISSKSTTSTTSSDLTKNTVASTSTTADRTTTRTSTSTPTTTSRVQTVPPALQPSLTVDAALVSVTPPTTSAALFGSFAALETFMVGLVPLSILAQKQRKRSKETNKGWLW